MDIDTPGTIPILQCRRTTSPPPGRCLFHPLLRIPYLERKIWDPEKRVKETTPWRWTGSPPALQNGYSPGAPDPISSSPGSDAQPPWSRAGRRNPGRSSAQATSYRAKPDEQLPGQHHERDTGCAHEEGSEDSSDFLP
jgi:hypothetical protein